MQDDFDTYKGVKSAKNIDHTFSTASVVTEVAKYYWCCRESWEILPSNILRMCDIFPPKKLDRAFVFVSSNFYYLQSDLIHESPPTSIILDRM